MKFNSQMLKLAREMRGYTQSKLSDAMGVAQGTISKVEKNIMTFDEELAKTAAECLKFPLSFFRSDDIIIPIQGEYRRKLSASVREFNSNFAKITIVERQIIKLLDSLEISENEIPIWNVEEDGTPSMCAKFLRKQWRLPRGRIENLSLLVEKYGAIIIPLSLIEMDGFSMYTHHGIPLIFINRHLPPDRYRMTLAHELGHIIMHLSLSISSDRDKEKEVFSFAAEFLMPEQEIRPQLTKLNLAILLNLKKYWKTSMQAIIYRAKDLGVLSENQIKYLWMQVGAEGYKKKEPLVFQSEQPVVLGQIIDAYINDLAYSQQEIAALIDFHLDDFLEIYLNSKLSILKKVY